MWLLPSGPDQVGEASARRRSPRGYMKVGARESKRAGSRDGCLPLGETPRSSTLPSLFAQRTTRARGRPAALASWIACSRQGVDFRLVGLEDEATFHGPGRATRRTCAGSPRALPDRVSKAWLHQTARSNQPGNRTPRRRLPKPDSFAVGASTQGDADAAHGIALGVQNLLGRFARLVGPHDLEPRRLGWGSAGADPAVEL